jgi:hypothetical protein
MMDKSIREIERERQGLQTQEKKLIVEIKKNAKQGQMVLFFYLRYCGFVGREKRFSFSFIPSINWVLWSTCLKGGCESNGKRSDSNAASD